MKPIIYYWPHILIVLTYTAIVAVIGHAVGSWDGDGRAAKAELALAHVQRDAAQQIAEAEAKARESERQRVESLAEIARRYEGQINEIESRTESVVSDLRAGNLRLRQHWQAAVATCAVSRDSATALHLEREAELREQGARDLVRVGAEADARVEALIEAYEALRRP